VLSRDIAPAAILLLCYTLSFSQSSHDRACLYIFESATVLSPDQKRVDWQHTGPITMDNGNTVLYTDRGSIYIHFYEIHTC